MQQRTVCARTELCHAPRHGQESQEVSQRARATEAAGLLSAGRGCAPRRGLSRWAPTKASFRGLARGAARAAAGLRRGAAPAGRRGRRGGGRASEREPRAARGGAVARSGVLQPGADGGDGPPSVLSVVAARRRAGRPVRGGGGHCHRLQDHATPCGPRDRGQVGAARAGGGAGRAGAAPRPGAPSSSCGHGRGGPATPPARDAPGLRGGDGLRRGERGGGERRGPA